MKKKIPGFYLALVALVLAGLFFLFALAGYTVTGLLCFGIAGLMVLFRLAKWLERRSKAGLWLRRGLTALLCLGVLAAAGTWTVILGESRWENSPDCDYIIVLGAGVNGNVPSQSLAERLDATYDYLILHPDTVCVVSGGQGSGENITEARCMYDNLIGRGIQPDRIWQEDQATNTRENLSYSLAVIQERTGVRPARVGVVSSEYHLFRACEFARETGVVPVGIPAKTRNPLLRMNYYLREILAVWYYIILGG